MDKYEEKASLCALNRIFGFEPKIALALIRHLGSASEVFRLKERDMSHLLGPHSRYSGKITSEAVDLAASELIRLGKADIDFIGWTEDDYPSMLRECPDAPAGLYVRTKTPLKELWKSQSRISIVGTRDISPYGREWCIRTVSALASTSEKPTIVSGLALGTDYYAHRTALEEGLPTIGVMATGPETVYPARHRVFAEKLYTEPGCALVTDYPPGTAPLAIHFLRRNRIIAGLSKATILIESRIKGGGMMTSRLAFSYDRDVYALPGRADDIRSQGCNLLIKDRIAEPLTSTDDLIGNLGMKSSGRRERICTRAMLEFRYGKDNEITESMSRIIDIICKERGITIEELSVKTGYDYAKTAQLTGTLEMDGFINIDLLQRCFMTQVSQVPNNLLNLQNMV